ncbi:MAG: LysM peptidoglycan-binding domain-containing protein [Chloroflexota bacterium]|nr:MAG: LysM peptidoglycan-binding domain-containing protein [Chloroflexota bacterium]
MVQSSHVSDQALAEALVEGYYPALSRLVAATLSPEKGAPAKSEAYAALVATLAEAVSKRRQFWGEPPLREWLYEIALDIAGEENMHAGVIARLQSKRDSATSKEEESPTVSPEEQHLDGCPDCRLCLDRLQQIEEQPGLTHDEAVLLAGDVVRLVEQRRQKKKLSTITRRGIAAALGLVLLAWFVQANGVFAPDVVASPTRWPTSTPAPTPTPLPGNMFIFSYYVQPEDTVNTIAERVGVPAETILQWNRLTDPGDLRPGSSINLPAEIHVPTLAATPVSPPEPLTARSDPQDVIQRIQESDSYLSSLWVTTQYFDYGPSGYFGPPTGSSILQVWSMQPDYALFISGDGENGVQWFTLYAGGFQYMRFRDNGEDYVHGNTVDEEMRSYLEF